MVNAISLILVSILVARGLGATDRGVFFLGFLAATVIAMIADLGMSMVSIVFGANREIPSRQLHGIAATLAVGAALAAGLVLLPFADFWTGEVLRGLDTTMLVIVCLGIVPQLYGQILVALLTGMGHVPEVATMRIVQAVAYPLMVGPAAFTGDPRWALGAWLATVSVLAIGLAYYALRYAGSPRLPSRSTLRRAVAFGGRSWVGTLSTHGFLRLDVFILGATSGPRPVGIYSLASIVAERISLISQAVYGATAEPIGRGGPDAAPLAALSLRLMLTVLAPAALFAGLVSWPVFPLVFGDGFADAALPFTLLLPGTVAFALWAVIALYIVSALRRPGTTTLIQATALLISLPGYYFAIEAGGMTGAALVSSATYIAVFLSGVVVLVRNTSLAVRDLIPGREDPSKVIELARSSLRRDSPARRPDRPAVER